MPAYWTPREVSPRKSKRKRAFPIGPSRQNARRIRTDLRERVEVMLALLDAAGTVNAMRLPRYRLHSLKGNLKGYWSVTVRANWRIIFRFENGDVYDVDMIDYH